MKSEREKERERERERAGCCNELAVIVQSSLNGVSCGIAVENEKKKIQTRKRQEYKVKIKQKDQRSL